MTDTLDGPTGNDSVFKELEKLVLNEELNAFWTDEGFDFSDNGLFEDQGEMVHHSPENPRPYPLTVHAPAQLNDIIDQATHSKYPPIYVHDPTIGINPRDTLVCDPFDDPLSGIGLSYEDEERIQKNLRHLQSSNEPERNIPIDPELRSASENYDARAALAPIANVVRSPILMYQTANLAQSSYSVQPTHTRKRFYDEITPSFEDDESDFAPDDDEFNSDGSEFTHSQRKKRCRQSTKKRKQSLEPPSQKRTDSAVPSGHIHNIPLRYAPGPQIPDFDPQPYTGPPAEKAWAYTVQHRDRGISSYWAYKPVSDFGKFKYDERGRFEKDVFFKPQEMIDFIKQHPLGKNLLFRLEKRPTMSGMRYSEAHHVMCRSQCCIVSKDKREMGEGQPRVAVEEVLGRVPRRDRNDNDPYFAAGYFHVECFEHLVDIGQLIRASMFRSMPREQLDKEPRTSRTEPNRLCLAEKVDNCFRRFCKKLYDEPEYDGYATNVVEKLSTILWLTNVRRKEINFRVKPCQMTLEEARYLAKHKGPDPGWGGSRFTGLKVAEAEKVVYLGNKDGLKGSAHNVKDANIAALQDVQNQMSLDVYSDGEEWHRIVLKPPKDASKGSSSATSKCTKKPKKLTKRGGRYSGSPSRYEFPPA